MRKKALSSGNKRASEKSMNRILMQAFMCALLVLSLWSFVLLPSYGQPNPIYPNPIWGGGNAPTGDVALWDIAVSSNPNNWPSILNTINTLAGYANIVRWVTPMNFPYGGMGWNIYVVFWDGHPFTTAEANVTFWDTLPGPGVSSNYVISFGEDCWGISADAQGVFKYSIIVEYYGSVVARADPILRINVSSGVGGVVASVDKFGLLAPYIGLASTIIVATVASAIYVKRVKRRKEKQ